LNIGQTLLFVKQGNEFLPNHSAIFFQSLHPVERFGVYDGAVSHWRLACHPVFDGVTEFFQRHFDDAPAQLFQIDARARFES
jgi:hypothetical protein